MCVCVCVCVCVLLSQKGTCSFKRHELDQCTKYECEPVCLHQGEIQANI